ALSFTAKGVAHRRRLRLNRVLLRLPQVGRVAFKKGGRTLGAFALILLSAVSRAEPAPSSCELEVLSEGAEYYFFYCEKSEEVANEKVKTIDFVDEKIEYSTPKPSVSN